MSASSKIIGEVYGHLYAGLPEGLQSLSEKEKEAEALKRTGIVFARVERMIVMQRTNRPRMRMPRELHLAGISPLIANSFRDGQAEAVAAANRRANDAFQETCRGDRDRLCAALQKQYGLGEQLIRKIFEVV